MRHEVIHLKNHFPFLGENSCDPLLTTYLPHNPAEMNRQDLLRPSILICPGGGYNSVSQREAEPVGLHFLTEGYNVFVLTYSVAVHHFPVQIREVAAAMDLIYNNAADWNVDTSRIAILGFSAGGHLAAHYTNSYDCAEVREVFPDSKPVQASILCYPVITATEGQCHPGSFQKLVGHFPLTEEENAKFSCHRLVTAFSTLTLFPDTVFLSHCIFTPTVITDLPLWMSRPTSLFPLPISWQPTGFPN